MVYFRYKKEMDDAQKSWQDRLAEEKAATQMRIDELESEQKQKKSTPYLWNLNEDPSLCSKLVHFIEGNLDHTRHQTLSLLVQLRNRET